MARRKMAETAVRMLPRYSTSQIGPERSLELANKNKRHPEFFWLAAATEASDMKHAQDFESVNFSISMKLQENAQ
jgi:hypothetical protein